MATLVDVGVVRLTRGSVDDSKGDLLLAVPFACCNIQPANSQACKPAAFERRLEQDDSVRDFPDHSAVIVDVVFDQRVLGARLV